MGRKQHFCVFLWTGLLCCWKIFPALTYPSLEESSSVWEHGHFALHWLNITFVQLKLFFLKVLNYVFSASFLLILGSVGVIVLPLSTVSWRVSSRTFSELVLFSLQQNKALLFFILLLSFCSINIAWQRGMGRDGNAPGVSRRVHSLIMFSYLPPWSWYRSLFKPHLEQECDGLLENRRLSLL